MKKVKILFQGDSITDAGRDRADSHDLGKGYPKYAAEFIRSAHPEIEFEFIDLGISGNQTKDLVARLEADFVDVQPDIVSILIGVNDVSHELTMNCGVSPEKFGKIYGMLIEEIRECLPEIKIIILEPFVMKGICTEKLWDRFSTEVRKMAEVSKQVAEKYGLDFVPLQERFDELAGVDGASHWSADGIHPTAEGHRIIKEELKKAIEKYINEC